MSPSEASHALLDEVLYNLTLASLCDLKAVRIHAAFSALNIILHGSIQCR